MSTSRKKKADHERLKLLHRVEDAAEIPMALLGLVWLVLLIVEFTSGLSQGLQNLSYVIWGVFILDFILKFILAPHKGTFLRKSWLTIISLLLPAFRVVRFLRIFRALRGIRVVKVLGTLNRSMKSLGKTMKRRGLAYVIALTVIVVFAGGAGMLAFERDAPGGSGFRNYWDALWWTAMLLTSLGSEYWPKTSEGRMLCLLLGIYGFAVFGYITATLASFFVGRDAEEPNAPVAGAAEIADLKKEIHRLHQVLEVIAANVPSKPSDSEPSSKQQ